LERVFRFRGVNRNAAEIQGSAEFTLEPNANPYATPTLVDPSGDDPGDDAVLVAGASFAPIVISAAFFAVMHWSHGPDPAALFVLALGLGYLYQRTHRWMPSVVTHACLNGTTMLLLWYGLDELPP
jgi:Type II CAAX prenyl endopeptidase Rce1-like